jgi:hypothetical protein
MRELTFIETGYLSFLMLISLVLPLFATKLASKDQVSNRWRMRIVLAGQILLGLAGFLILLSSRFSHYALAFGVIGCGFCTILLRRGNLSIPAVHS